MVERKPMSSSSYQWLGLCGLLFVGLYGVTLYYFPLFRLYQTARAVLTQYTEQKPLVGLLLAVGVLVLFGTYALGASLVQQSPNPPRQLRVIILTIPLICTIIAFLIQSITSTDLYDYLFRGRMIAYYQTNTLVITPRAYTSDPLFPYVVWRDSVSAYGPLWEGLSWFTARLTGETPGRPTVSSASALLHLLLAYKGLAIIGYWLCGAAIWMALAQIAPIQRWFGLYLWLWNPSAIWESAVSGHNDVWLMLPLIVAVWAIAHPSRVYSVEHAHSHIINAEEAHLFIHSLLALTTLVIGGLVKYIALLFVPVILASTMRRLSLISRLIVLLCAGIICGCLIILAYLPFWAGIDTLANFKNRGTLFTSTWLAVVRHLLEFWTSPDTARIIALLIGFGLLVMGVIWITWRSWYMPQQVTQHMLWLMVWIVFVCNPWFLPWYVLWILALVALHPNQAPFVNSCILFCCIGMLSYLITVFVTPRFGWKYPSLGGDLVLAMFIYLPPLFAVIACVRPSPLARVRRFLLVVAPSDKNA